MGSKLVTRSYRAPESLDMELSIAAVKMRKSKLQLVNEAIAAYLGVDLEDLEDCDSDDSGDPGFIAA